MIITLVLRTIFLHTVLTKFQEVSDKYSEQANNFVLCNEQREITLPTQIGKKWHKLSYWIGNRGFWVLGKGEGGREIWERG